MVPREFINILVCSCAYTCTRQVVRGELRGEMSGIIDVEYKHIGNTVGELIANPFSIITQTRSVDKEGSAMKTLEFVTQVCFVGVQTFQNLSERKSHGDGNDCPPCSVHDGNLNCSQAAERLSLFGYER